jgi:hypothetical protein
MISLPVFFSSSGLVTTSRCPVVKLDVRIGGFDADGRRDHSMLDAVQGLDQAGDAGGGFKMAQIAFHRADRQRLAERRRLPRASPMARVSIGSPTAVPVPCASR